MADAASRSSELAPSKPLAWPVSSRRQRPGRVLLVANNFPPVRGGSAVVYENLARRSGGRIVVLAPSHNYMHGGELPGWREHDRQAPYRVVRRPLLRNRLYQGPPLSRLSRLARLPADLAQSLATAAAVLRLARAEGARAIWVGELLPNVWLFELLRWVPGVRTVAYVHGEEMTTDSPWEPDHWRARRALKVADRVVAVSRFAEQTAAALLGQDGRAKLTLISNGVDRARFRPQTRRADLVERYGLADKFVFVCVCRLIEKKGVDNAIRAFATFVGEHPDSRLLIGGTGPFAPNLRALAQAHGIADRVVFLGDIGDAELADHYALGDVFVMPNRALADGDTEGFGLVFLEANACGLPVIAGRDGGSVDAVAHGVNGLVVDGASVPAIAGAMLQLREDAELRERLRQGGLERAAADDWDGKIERFIEVCVG